MRVLRRTGFKHRSKKMSNSRRNFLKKSGLVGAGLLAGKEIAAAQHKGHVPVKPPTQAQPQNESKPTTSVANVLVETPDVPPYDEVPSGK
jgi:hypothetical protein